MEIPEVKSISIDDLFSNLPKEVDEVLKLPSLAKLYNNKSISLRPMKFEDEKALVLARKEKKEDSVDVLLSRCLTGVDSKDLLAIDKFFIILRLRIISYGEIYNAIGICSNCNEENDLGVNLSHLPVEYVPESFQEPMEITLPVTKKRVKVKYPRSSDSEFLSNEEAVYDNLWRFIVSVEGSEDRVLISNFILDKRMPIKDLHVMVKHISCKDYGVRTKVKFACTKCKVHNTIELPLSVDFFSGS